MTDWVHIGLEIALIFSSGALSFYSFKLYSKFFKGGIFGSSFKLFGFASLLFALAYTVDVVFDLIEPSFTEVKLIYFILNLSFVVVLFYSVHKLYKAWAKMGVR